MDPGPVTPGRNGKLLGISHCVHPETMNSRLTVHRFDSSQDALKEIHFLSNRFKVLGIHIDNEHPTKYQVQDVGSIF